MNEIIGWLSKSGVWIVPLMAIIGTTFSVLLCIWKILRGNSNEKEYGEISSRAMRVSILVQKMAGNCVGFFLILLFLATCCSMSLSEYSVSFYNFTVWMFIASAVTAFVALILHVLGKFGEEWFKD